MSGKNLNCHVMAAKVNASAASGNEKNFCTVTQHNSDLGAFDCWLSPSPSPRPSPLAGTIQLTSVWNEQITPIYGQERGIYAASTPNHPVTSKNSIGIGFSTVKRHKCRAPAVSHLNRSGLGRG